MAPAWQWVADLVTTCLHTRRPIRDAIAAASELRRESVAVRAEVARSVVAVLGARRRLEWLLWSDAAPELPPAAHGMALVLARAVETGAMPADGAARAFMQATRRELEFARVSDFEAAIDGLDDPVRRFGIRHSMPDWAAAALQQQFGADAEALARALAGPPPRTVRTNTLRCASRAELATRFAAEGVEAVPTSFAPEGLVVAGDADLFATRCWRDGCFEQQDEASQLAALVTAPPPGGRVLDLCAGGGGKTLAMAAALANRGEILATDVHSGRLQALRERARRAGASNVRAMLVDEELREEAVEAFGRRADRILVDAPCTGTGSWRRRPEARWSVSGSDLLALVATQERLLERAAALLQPGARLIYATCSLLAEENQQVVARLLVRRPELEAVRIAELLGGAFARPIADATGTFLSVRPDIHGTDGFFAAVVRRRRSK